MGVEYLISGVVTFTNAEPAIVTTRFDGETEMYAIGPQSPAWLESWEHLQSVEGQLGLMCREHLSKLAEKIRRVIAEGEYRSL